MKIRDLLDSLGRLDPDMEVLVEGGSWGIWAATVDGEPLPVSRYKEAHHLVIRMISRERAKELTNLGEYNLKGQED